MPVLCSCCVLGGGMDVAGEHPGAGGNLEERLPQEKPNLLLLPTAGVGI